jgi:Xaa-Pro aminopeptidase
MEERQIDLLCLFSPAQVFYLTGFAFIATERPICAVYHPEQDVVLLYVPLLEKEHADEAHVDGVDTYDEYPGTEHPMTRFARVLAEQGLLERRAGAESDGYGGGFGYVGPRLSDALGHAVAVLPDLIGQMMWIKSDEEIDLIREACYWAGEAHRLLQKYTIPGAVETDVAFRASHEASMRMVKSLGPEYRAMRFGSLPTHADYRGQIGARSAIPHSMTTNATFNVGDVLVTGAAAEVGGYLSELERTMVLGVPTGEQRRYFNWMTALQNLSIDAIRPGVRCSDVDRTASAFFSEQGISESWRHHTGHAIGYGMHEAPFLDIGDETIIEPGMVFTVEPGIYVPGVAGFRHSDTVLVTEDGVELLTPYPRDLESLTLPV